MGPGPRCSVTIRPPSVGTKLDVKSHACKPSRFEASLLYMVVPGQPKLQGKRFSQKNQQQQKNQPNQKTNQGLGCSSVVTQLPRTYLQGAELYAQQDENQREPLLQLLYTVIISGCEMPLKAGQNPNGGSYFTPETARENEVGWDSGEPPGSSGKDAGEFQARRACLWLEGKGSPLGKDQGLLPLGTTSQFQPGHVPFMIRHLPGPSWDLNPLMPLVRQPWSDERVSLIWPQASSAWQSSGPGELRFAP